MGNGQWALLAVAVAAPDIHIHIQYPIPIAKGTLRVAAGKTHSHSLQCTYHLVVHSFCTLLVITRETINISYEKNGIGQGALKKKEKKATHLPTTFVCDCFGGFQVLFLKIILWCCSSCRETAKKAIKETEGKQ
jgi:hypothetical protein